MIFQKLNTKSAKVCSVKGAGQNIIAIIFDPLYLKVNSVTENTTFGSFISVVKSVQFRYDLIVISLSINLDMPRMGL